VGWEHAFNWAVLRESLEGSLFGVVALDGDQVIGMGRLVGDGAMYFYIQDVTVHPDYQRRGIGQQILDALLEHTRQYAPAFVGLFATDDAREWYARNGLSSGDLTGMSCVVR
jgi:ribosomal protein S18 acetylase RimI-like enzyme